MREAIERFCRKIVEALQKPWLSPEERERQEEAEARRRAEEDGARKEAGAQAARKKAEDETGKKDEDDAGRTKVQGDLAKERRRQTAANWRSLGNFLDKVAKGWAALTCVVFIWLLVGALKGSTGGWIGNAYVPGFDYGTRLVEGVV